MKIIEQSKKPSFKQADMVTKFGITAGCVSKILKKKNIEEAFDSSHNNKRKHISHGRMDQLEGKLHDWIIKTSNKGFPISGPTIIAKAEEMSRALPSSSLGDSIRFSGGWLDKFQKRFNLQFKKFHGERRAADEAAAKDWLENILPDLLEAYPPANFFNADETGIFYKRLADRGFVQGGKKPSGGKAAKDQLSVLITCNMDGSEKKKLLVIGKSKKPRGFPRDFSTLPVQYENSKNAWMISNIFTKFLKGWDQELQHADRKIVLLLDNFSGHPHIEDELTHIRLEFMPLNTTSIIQPADAGIIKTLKGYYRSALCSRLIQEMETEAGDAISSSKKIPVLDAIFLCSKAWKKVTATTIKNCFDHALFSLEPDDPLPDAPLPHGMDREDFEAEIR